MKLETFFEKFEQFADAPDAVTKMRELVLELSATGRLIPEVLDRSVGEDTKLMATIVELVMGQAPAGDECNTEGHGTVFVKVGEFGPLYPREEVWTTNPLKFAKKGDVLVCVVGATVGKLNLGIDCAIGRSVAAIRPSSALDTKFLYYALIPYTLRLRRNSRGSAQGVIGKAELNAVSLWVPSREVQKQIVAKVDELMALCDRLEAQQQERETRHATLARASLARFADAPTPANLQFLFHPSYVIPPADLRKSILTLAVQGKLVPQDPNDEPADELLARLDKKRASLLKAAYPNCEEASTQLRKQLAQSLPSRLKPLAPGWAWATLIQASLLVVDCHNKTAPYVESGTRLLRTTNIRNGRLNLAEPKFVDDTTYERWSARCKPEPGDVLITREAPMGEVCIIPAGMKVCLGQRMMLVRLVEGTIESKYLLCSLMAPDLMERVQDKPVGATVQHLRVGGVETLLTPVPPLAEQRRIVAKVEQLMALVDELETQLAASRVTAANLLSAIVTELIDTTRDGKVAAPSVSDAVRRGRPKESQPEITQATP